MNAAQYLTDDGDLRRYFASIPHIADDDLDPYQYRLYGHYKRVCGENDGECKEYTSTTAKLTKIGISKVKSTRKWLADNGWISIKYANKGTGDERAHINIIDRWKENFDKYTPSPRNGGVDTKQRGGSHIITLPPSPRNDRRKTIEEKQIKKKKREVTNNTLPSPAPSHSLDSLSVSPTTTPLPLPETEATESTPVTAKRRKTQPPDAAAPPSHADHPYVAIYRQTFHRYPGKAQMAQLATMATTPQGEGRFKAACAAWLMAGYKPNNLRGILDWYRDGVPDYQAANPNAHTRPVPKPKPTATSPYAAMTDAERAAYLASCEPIEDDEYE